MKRSFIAAIATGMVVLSGAATAGSVAWNVSIGGVAGTVGYGVGVATIPAYPPPVLVCAPPPVVVLPSPVFATLVFAPYGAVPRYHHRMCRPMMAPPVFVAAPPWVAAPVRVASPPIVFAPPPVFRAGR